jgi:hypothetical protein
MSKRILISLIALMVIIGVSFALGPASKISHTECIPGTAYTIGTGNDNVQISQDLVYDTTIFVVTKPDTGEAYIEVFPYLGWPFVKEDKDITVNVSYQDTKQQNLNPRGLYGLDANGGWIYLHGAVDQSGYYSYVYQTRRTAAREIYAGNKIYGVFSAFKVDIIE